MRKSCVQIVDSLRVGVGKAVGFMHQVVFATVSVGINSRVVPTLCQLFAQASAQLFSVLKQGRMGDFSPLYTGLMTKVTKGNTL